MKTAVKIRVANFCMFLNMFAQSAIFPGILTDIEVGLSPWPVDADRWRFVSLVRGIGQLVRGDARFDQRDVELRHSMAAEAMVR